MDVESLLLTSDSALKSRIVVLRKDKDDCVVLTSLQFFDTVDCGIVTRDVLPTPIIPIGFLLRDLVQAGVSPFSNGQKCIAV